MDPRFLWVVALTAAAWPAAAAGAGGSAAPAFVAAAASEARATPKAKKARKAVKIECNTGPLRKTFGGLPWTFYSCSDGTTLIGFAAKGNPAGPLFFFLNPSEGGNRFASIPGTIPQSAAAARAEMVALPLEAMARLVAETRGEAVADSAAPAPAAAPAGDYEEERIGGWRLRTDRKARTFGVVWMNTGVLELAARTADGKAEIAILDNGAWLLARLRTPACFVAAHPSGYEGGTEAAGRLADFAGKAAELCSGSAYDSEIRTWLPDFPAAILAMRARARALFGPGITRCVEPPFDPGRPPPHHPPCGFPPPEIGENHPE